MWIAQGVAWLFTAATVAGVWLFALRIVRARAKSRLLEAMHGVAWESPDFVTVTALCCREVSEECIEQLLRQEHPGYEVAVVVDGEADPELFAQLVARYALLRADFSPPNEGVRALYRSHRREYRPLLLFDAPTQKCSTLFKALRTLSLGDYLLPVDGRCDLHPGAVERMAREIAEWPPGTIDRLRTAVGGRVVLYAIRRAEWRAGRIRLKRHLPRRTLTLYVPLRPAPHARCTPLAAGALLGILGASAAACAGWWATTLLLADTALLAGWAAWLHSSPFSDPKWGSERDVAKKNNKEELFAGNKFHGSKK